MNPSLREAKRFPLPAGPGYGELTMAEIKLKPEQAARVTIDSMLEAAGWVVRDYREIDLSVARGLAVREVPAKTGV